MSYTLGVVIGTKDPYLMQDIATYGEALAFVAEMAIANPEESGAGAQTTWYPMVPFPVSSSLAIKIAGQQRVALQTWQLDSNGTLTLFGAFAQDWESSAAVEFSETPEGEEP